jgi:hypothetical protein
VGEADPVLVPGLLPVLVPVLLPSLPTRLRVIPTVLTALPGVTALPRLPAAISPRIAQATPHHLTSPTHHLTSPPTHHLTSPPTHHLTSPPTHHLTSPTLPATTDTGHMSTFCPSLTSPLPMGGTDIAKQASMGSTIWLSR